MCNTQAFALLHELVIPPFRCDSPTLSPFVDTQERQDLSKTSECCDNGSVLIPHIRDPGRNAIIDSKAHRVAYDNNRDHRLATQVFVGINAIAHAELGYGVLLPHPRG